MSDYGYCSAYKMFRLKIAVHVFNIAQVNSLRTMKAGNFHYEDQSRRLGLLVVLKKG